MKRYQVTIVLMLDPSKDEDTNSPKTKQVDFIVVANLEAEAISMAKEKDTSKLSVWESYASEIKETDRELQLRMDNMKQRVLGGSNLWIRDNDCLTIHRGANGEAQVEREEGNWTDEEIRMALYLYEFTEASTR